MDLHLNQHQEHDGVKINKISSTSLCVCLSSCLLSVIELRFNSYYVLFDFLVHKTKYLIKGPTWTTGIFGKVPIDLI